jgi:hypothetical protein
MAALLPSAEVQFIDANGDPYAGGSLATYVAGTTTPKTTWKDAAGTSANTNPITLDAAGRAIIYGDGIYRTILTDAAGNLVWDQLSNTLVSAAMAPVCIAADLTTALQAMGVTAAIAAEAALRTAADAAINTSLSGYETTTNASIAAIVSAATTLTAALAAETTRAEAAEAGLAQVSPKQGNAGTTDSSGHLRVTFSSPFPAACTSFHAQNQGSGISNICLTAQADRYGADVWAVYGGSSTPVSAITFYYIAFGN